MPMKSPGARMPCWSTQARNRSGSLANRIRGRPANQHTSNDRSRKMTIPPPAIQRFCLFDNCLRRLMAVSLLRM